jgi:integrase
VGQWLGAADRVSDAAGGIEALAASRTMEAEGDGLPSSFDGSIRAPKAKRSAVKWYEAAAAIGAPGLHCHDPRHTGNSLAAATGASLRDLMDRMGHDSARVALIYQHKTAAAGQVTADALSAQIKALEHRDEGRPATG